MNQDQINQIQKVIEITLINTEKIWEDKSESHAYLVGYLQGALKVIADELKK
jgi:hypothetical protein